VADAILAVTPKQESPQTVSLTLREEISNTLIGYVEITLVPTGARIEAWHGLNDSALDHQLIVRSEKP